MSKLWIGTLVLGVCTVAATARAQNAGPRWRSDVQLSALRHEGGAVGPDQPGRDLAATGFGWAIGIGRLTGSGAGVRLSLRELDVPDAWKDGSSICIAAGPGLSVGGPCGFPSGAFRAVGLSLDVATGLEAAGPPAGLEFGADAFRSIARPHAGRFAVPLPVTIAGLHVTGVLALGRSSPWRATLGAQWLSGDIVRWMYPLGLRYTF